MFAEFAEFRHGVEEREKAAITEIPDGGLGQTADWSALSGGRFFRFFCGKMISGGNMLDEKLDVGILHAVNRLAGSVETGAIHEGKSGSAV